MGSATPFKAAFICILLSLLDRLDTEDFRICCNCSEKSLAKVVKLLDSDELARQSIEVFQCVKVGSYTVFLLSRVTLSCVIAN